MLFVDLFKLIVSDLKKRKFSTFLTFFAISLGILAIFVIILVSIGFEQSIEKEFESFGSNRLYVTPTGSGFGMSNQKRNFTDKEVSLIESKPYVDKVYPYYIKNTQVKYGNEFVTKQVFGSKLSEDFFDDFNMDVAVGRFTKESEKYSILVGPKAAEELFDKEIKVGSNLYVKDTKFKVVGIMESIGNPEDDSNIYFNIETLRELFDEGDRVALADVVIVSGYDMKLAEENLIVLLENRLGEDSIDVISPEQLLEQVSSILNIVQLTLGGIAFVSLIVGALGIINTMFVIVTEKVKDIGIMKAIGATNFQILSLFMFQAGIFGFLGAVLGVFLGSLIAVLFESIAHSAGYEFLEITIEPVIVMSLLSFGFVIGILSGLIPSYRASKLNIIEAIRK